MSVISKGKKNVPLTKEREEELGVFISRPLRSANYLANTLFKDSSFYESSYLAWVSPEDAKKIFLYGVCKEVLKAVINLMQARELISERPITNDAKDLTGKAVFGSIIDTQSLWLRKCIELLSLLINFEHYVQSEKEYRVYLSADNLDHFLSQQKEFRDFYSKEIVGNIQSSINTYAQRVETDLKDIGNNLPWLLDKEYGDRVKKINPSIFLSKRQMYLRALDIATDDQKIALGILYTRSYSRYSAAAHPAISGRGHAELADAFETVFGNIPITSIVCMHIMDIAYRLAGVSDPEGGIRKIMGENFENSEASRNLAHLRKEYTAGDLVITTFGELAEILKRSKGRADYIAYRVKYLSKPPLPEYPEDWLQSSQITGHILRKADARRFFETNIKIHKIENEEVRKIWPKVMEQPDELLYKSAKDVFTDLDRIGALIPMLEQTGYLKRNSENKEPSLYKTFEETKWIFRLRQEILKRAKKLKNLFRYFK